MMKRTLQRPMWLPYALEKHENPPVGAELRRTPVFATSTEFGRAALLEDWLPRQGFTFGPNLLLILRPC